MRSESPPRRSHQDEPPALARADRVRHTRVARQWNLAAAAQDVFGFASASCRLAAGEAIDDEPKKQPSIWEKVVAVISIINMGKFAVFMYCFRDILYDRW